MEIYAETTGDGLSLVLIHAFPLSSAMYDGQRAALGARARLITPDMRGFGRSALGADEPSVDAMADDVAALLDADGVERAVVGGQSMGGCVAMAFCRHHPDRLAGVVLAGTKAGADAPEAAAGREQMAEAVRQRGTAVLTDQVLPRLVGETTRRSRKAVYTRVRAMVEAAPVDAVVWAQRAMAGRPDSLGMLRELTVPALVLAGAEDELSSPADAETMAAAMTRSRLRTIEQAGHLMAVERPDEFNWHVAEFIESLD